MDKDRRIQELLEANNRLVEINRKLKNQLLRDRNQFNFYAEEHRAKEKTFRSFSRHNLADSRTDNLADAEASANKALTNEKFVNDVEAVLTECSPR